MNQMSQETKRYEEFAYVLDVLVHGRLGSRFRHRDGQLVQVVGEKFFTLLEIVVSKEAHIRTFQRIYVGKETRPITKFVLGRINYQDLTVASRMELPEAIEKIIVIREKDFVSFFNTAQPINARLHSLALIPRIGRRYVTNILREREKKPFTSLNDLQQRTKIPNPVKILRKRIIDELIGEHIKYRLFTRH